MIIQIVVLFKDRAPGGGADSSIKVPVCVSLVSEDRPILNDTLSYKTYPY